MTEKLKKVTSYRVYKQCEKCRGYMTATGSAFTTNKTHYEHKCDDCGDYQTYERCYPYIRHIED